MNKDYDFSGWATRNNIQCSDGRTIMKDAFKDNDGQKVPLVWNHQHDDPNEVLGHAVLENREDGVYAYCKFNDTESGQTAKSLVMNGDVDKLSIYANKLKSKMNNVIHGCIREVSLVLAGANPGAYIDSIMVHGEGAEQEEEVIIYNDEQISLEDNENDNNAEKNQNGNSDKELEHGDDHDYSESGEKEENKKMEDDKKKEEDKKDEKQDEGKKEKTVQEIVDSMNEEQKEALYALVGQALKDAKEEKDNKEDKKEDGGEEKMKHNVFDNDAKKEEVLSHAEEMEIVKLAKTSSVGSFQTALQMYAEENELAHADAEASGFSTKDIGKLFPEYQEVRPGAPELITTDQGWINTVLSKVHKSPISRIRTSQVDIRKLDELKLRAKGYAKGKQKTQVGNFDLIRRTTDPQTIYVKNAIHRDDIVDITDFDYVNYLYQIDKMNLNEELATAIMLGDGREGGADGKIEEDKIRPIWKDDDLYTIHVDIDLEAAKKELQGTNTGANFGENYIMAEAMVNTVLYAREQYRGTGMPDFYCTPRVLNTMLLARDLNGRRIYNTVAELASALNVGAIHTAEQFAGKERTDKETKKHKLLAILCNLNDYSLGATKGGEITHFTQFDIDFNQEKSLLETRCSGALTRVYSAIAIEEKVGE